MPQRHSSGFRLATSLLAFLAGAAVLLGWAIDSSVLKSLIPGTVSMKPNSALSMLLLGVGLAVLSVQRLRMLPHVLGATVAVLGLVTLVQYGTGLDLGIDQLLFREHLPAAVDTSAPGRMSITAALAYMFLGVAMAVYDAGRPRVQRFAEGLAILAGLVALVGLTESLYGPEALPLGRTTRMSLLNALALLVLCAGVLGTRTSDGLVAPVLARDATGHMLRILLPTAVLLPIAIGGISVLGHRREWWNTATGEALEAVVSIVVLVSVVWYTVALVRARDLELRRRLQAEEALSRETIRQSKEMEQAFFALQGERDRARQRLAELEGRP
jgi:hypothetical protein